MKRQLTLIAQNGDTTGENGELDAPAEVIIKEMKLSSLILMLYLIAQK
jgi:hypothetical protein